MANSFSEAPEVAEIADLVAAIKAAEHVGKANRLHRICDRRFEAIESHPDRLELLRALLTHPSTATRMAAIWRCGFKNLLGDEAQAAARGLAERGGAEGKGARQWLKRRSEAKPAQAKVVSPEAIRFEPLPTALTFAEAEARIETRLGAEWLEPLRDSLLNSVRIWPKPPDADPLASRLGGLPALPEGFAWPGGDDEPMLFLGQFNCAEVKAAIGENPLPASGLLLFFGDEDEATGCGPYGPGGAAIYFDSLTDLRRAAPSVEAFEILPECGLQFFLARELPHPMSEAYASLKISAELTKTRAELRRELLTFGASRAEWRRDHPCKLFGWPDLIQRDIDFAAPEGESLLLQIGWYHDGVKYQDWGPGGHVYFAIGSDALKARRFDQAAMEIQCT